MLQVNRVDHILITIPPGKMAEARAFYSEVLGLKEAEGELPDWANWFTIGDIQIHLWEEADNIRSVRHPAFEVPDLEAARDLLTRHQLEISGGPEVAGRKRLFFRDPFGNRFELIEFEK
jgi:catechol 2,3-dioxygenase-like lactoylglutathione lyase family enzyme